MDTSTEHFQELIQCELCKRMLKSITNSHLRDKHGITTGEYKNRFPNCKMISDWHNNRFDVWRQSAENANQLYKAGNTPEVREKLKISVRNAVQSDWYRAQHSRIMKEVVKKLPDSIMWKSIKGSDHHHFGRSNYQRWLVKYGEEEARIRLLDWKSKNKLRSKSKNTKIELLVKDILTQNDIEYIHQFDRVEYFYADFYICKHNLILEVYGDYWHANPKKYKSDEIIKFPGNNLVKAQDIWDKDATRLDVFVSHGYNVCYIYGSDITEESILELIQENEDIVRTR